MVDNDDDGGLFGMTQNQDDFCPTLDLKYKVIQQVGLPKKKEKKR